MTTLADLTALVTSRDVPRTYKLGSVPAGPVYPYAVVGLGTPEKIARGADGQAANLNQFTVQFFGRTLDAVLDVATKADLDGVFIDGRLCERILSTNPYRDPDDSGVLAVLHTYQF